MTMQSHYLVYTHYTDLGLACSDPQESFDDACDQYADRRDDGYDATVMRVDPPANGRAGMMTDVTEGADELISVRVACRGYEVPKWLEGEA